MARIGRGAAHMVRIRTRRRPFTAPRQGRLKDAIRLAFVISRGKPLTTGELMNRCYPASVLLGDKRWYRQNVRRAALKLAVPCGRSHKRGRPILWAPRVLSVTRRSTAYSIGCECQQRCADGCRRQPIDDVKRPILQGDDARLIACAMLRQRALGFSRPLSYPKLRY
jgi:hypothetical protein